MFQNKYKNQLNKLTLTLMKEIDSSERFLFKKANDVFDDMVPVQKHLDHLLEREINVQHFMKESQTVLNISNKLEMYFKIIVEQLNTLEKSIQKCKV